MGHDEEPPPPTEVSDPEPELGTMEDDTLSGRSRVLKFARRLMDRKELAEDTMGVLSAVWSTSDKAKTEAVRLMAREFRSYLKELKLKEDLLKLMTSHSLEISVHLKPLVPAEPETTDEPGAPARTGK
jgi:hypothetical protein